MSPFFIASNKLTDGSSAAAFEAGGSAASTAAGTAIKLNTPHVNAAARFQSRKICVIKSSGGVLSFDFNVLAV